MSLSAIYAEQLPLLTAPGSVSSSCTRCSAAGPINDDEEVRKWDEDAEQATATIFLYLDERAECYVNNIRDPVDLRGMLRNIFERKGFSARFYLCQKFFTLQFTDYRKHQRNVMALYLDTYRSHVQQVRSSAL